MRLWRRDAAHYARRNARRLARIARWERPPANRSERLRAWASMLLTDHGLFRLVYLNRHRVGAGRLWRSAQPAPHQIDAMARAGLRTIVCLRGEPEYGSGPLERERCRALGLDFRTIALRSRAAPEAGTILALKRIYATIPYPALIHCKSGADRAGLAAALYLVFEENVPPREAMRQLSLRYGHVRQAKTGILDRFFTAYLEAAARDPIAFEDWVRERYDPVALEASVKDGRWSNLIVDRVLRRE
ncbi:tyrosine-protein phosphatase [Methylobacterium sp. J-068]|uniref:phosphatase domain-containing protein n=1 Tax=Methylobacterium sp. J-068 TaxID=2836649 RepID=UPI001FB88A73|nr:tyrosine-protein phosphatase [Methylobacterium sp. J-068]MCJ2034209.1 tyrosine-protein phosphatase [Methylobacterium sp. J-068]